MGLLERLFGRRRRERTEAEASQELRPAAESVTPLAAAGAAYVGAEELREAEEGRDQDAPAEDDPEGGEEPVDPSSQQIDVGQEDGPSQDIDVGGSDAGGGGDFGGGDFGGGGDVGGGV